MVQSIIDLNERQNRILNIVKAKFGLKNKSQAVGVIVESYESSLEPELRPEFVEEVIKLSDKHLKKYGRRKMRLAELDELTA